MSSRAEIDELRCSFCDKRRGDVRRFVAGHCAPPYVYICNECVDWFEKVPGESPGAGERRCSFCNKPLGEVAKVMAGPSDCICNECIDLCKGMLAEA